MIKKINLASEISGITSCGEKLIVGVAENFLVLDKTFRILISVENKNITSSKCYCPLNNESCLIGM